MTLTPSVRSTSSNGPENFASRSRTRNLTPPSRPTMALNVYSHALPATDKAETKRVAAALD
jgi:hypothetical protein